MQERNENTFKIKTLRENFIFDDIEYRYHANNLIFGPTEESIVEVHKKLKLAYKQYPHLKNIFDCLLRENQIRRLFILAQPGELVSTANMGEACGYFKVIKPGQSYLLNGENFHNSFIKLAVNSDMGTFLDESIHHYIYFRNRSTDPLAHLKRSTLNRWALIDGLQCDLENFSNINFSLFKTDPKEGIQFLGKMCEYKTRLESGVNLGKFSTQNANFVFQSEIASHLLALEPDIANHMFPRASTVLHQAIDEMPNWRSRYISQSFANSTANKLAILNKIYPRCRYELPASSDIFKFMEQMLLQQSDRVFKFRPTGLVDVEDVDQFAGEMFLKEKSIKYRKPGLPVTKRVNFKGVIGKGYPFYFGFVIMSLDNWSQENPHYLLDSAIDTVCYLPLAIFGPLGAVHAVDPDNLWDQPQTNLILANPASFMGSTLLTSGSIDEINQGRILVYVLQDLTRPLYRPIFELCEAASNYIKEWIYGSQGLIDLPIKLLPESLISEDFSAMDLPSIHYDNRENSDIQNSSDEWNENLSPSDNNPQQPTTSSESSDQPHEAFTVPKVSLPEWQIQKNGDYYQASATIELPPISPDNVSYDVMTEAYIQYLLNSGENCSANSDVQISSTPTHYTQFFNQNPNESNNKKLSFSEAMEIESFTLGTGEKENHDGTLFTLRTKGGADITATLRASTEIGYVVAVCIKVEWGAVGTTATCSEIATQVLSAGSALLPYFIPIAIALSGGVYLHKIIQKDKMEDLKERLELYLYKSTQEIATFFQKTLPDLSAFPDQNSNQFNEKYIQVQNEFKRLMRDLNRRIHYAYDHKAYGCSDQLIQAKQEAEQQYKIVLSSVCDQEQFSNTLKEVEDQNKNTPLPELIEKFKEISAIPKKTKEEAFMAIALHQLICNRNENAGNILEIMTENDLLQPITYIELPLSPEKPNPIGPKRIAGKHDSRTITSKNADKKVQKLIDAYNNYKKLVDDHKTTAEIEDAKAEFYKLLDPTKKDLEKIKLKEGEFTTAFEYYETIINALERNIGLSDTEITHEIPVFTRMLTAYDNMIKLDRVQKEFIEINKNLPLDILIKLIVGMTNKSVLQYTDEDLAKIGGLPSLILYRMCVSLSRGQFNEAQKLLEEAAKHVHFPAGNIGPLPVDDTYDPTAITLSDKWQVSRRFTSLNGKISKINECSSDSDRKNAIEKLITEMKSAIKDFNDHKEIRKNYEDPNGQVYLPSIIRQSGHDVSVEDWDYFITLLETKIDDLTKERNNIVKGNSLANIPNFTNVFEDIRQHADDGPDYCLKQIKEGNSVPESDPNKIEGIFKTIFGEFKLCEHIHALLIKHEFEAVGLILAEYKILKDEPGLDYFQLSLPRFKKYIQNNAPIDVWLDELGMFLAENNSEPSSPILMELYNYIDGTIGNDVSTNIFRGDLKAAITTLTKRENMKATEQGAKLLIKLEDALNSNNDMNSLFARLDAINTQQALIDERRKELDADNSTEDAENIDKEAQTLLEDKYIVVGQARKNINENKTKRGFHREAAEELEELAQRTPELADEFRNDSRRSYLANNFQCIGPATKNLDMLLDVCLANMKDSLPKKIIREIKSITQLFVPNLLSLIVIGIYERLKMPITALGAWGNTISNAILPATVASNQSGVMTTASVFGIKFQTTSAFAACINDIWDQLCADLMTPIKMDKLRAGNLLESLNHGSLMLLSQLGLKLGELVMQYTPIERFWPAHSRAQFRNSVYNYLNLGHSIAHSGSTMHSGYQLANVGWEVFRKGLQVPPYTPLIAAPVFQALLNVAMWYEHRQNASIGYAIEDPDRYLTEQAMGWGLLSFFGVLSLPLVATGWGLVAAAAATAATGTALIVATEKTDSSINQATGKALEAAISNMDYFDHIRQCFLSVTPIKLTSDCTLKFPIIDYVKRCKYLVTHKTPTDKEFEEVAKGQMIIFVKIKEKYSLYHTGKSTNTVEKQVINNPAEMRSIFENQGQLMDVDERKKATNIALLLVTDARIKNSIYVIQKLLSKRFGGLEYKQEQLPIANDARFAIFKYHLRRAFEEKNYDEVLKRTNVIQHMEQVRINGTYCFPAYIVWNLIISYRFAVLAESKNILLFHREYQEYSKYISDSAPENWREENWHFVQDAFKNIVVYFMKQCVKAATETKTAETKIAYLAEITKSYNYCDTWDKLLDKETIFHAAYQFYLADDIATAGKFLAAIGLDLNYLTEFLNDKKLKNVTQGFTQPKHEKQDETQGSARSKPKKYYAIVNQLRFTFEQIEVSGDGWCAFAAAGINNPEESLIALREHSEEFLRKSKIVEYVRIAIENNLYAKDETFDLISDNKKQLLSKIKKLRSEIDRLPSGSPEHDDAYANLRQFLKRSDVQTAYIKFILREKYADQNIVAACLHIQGKHLAAFSVRNDDATLLTPNFPDNLDITQNNVNCVLLDRSTCQGLSHYNQLKIKKIEPVLSLAVPPTIPRDALALSSTTFFSPPPRPPINDVSREIRNLETIATGNSQFPVSNLLGKNN